ncbi:MAG: sigma-70 family RNA polymerase sigma factor [Fimbriiglobus sp.]
MGTPRTVTDPFRPPNHGPFATCAWDVGRGRWKVALTPAARDLIADALTRFPRPAAVLARKWPAVARAARTRGLSADDLHELALFGLVRAAVLFCPDRGASFTTYALFAVRDEVRKEISRRAGEPAEFVRPDRDDVGNGSAMVGWDGFAGPDRDETAAVEQSGWLRGFLRKLGPRDRSLIEGYYGLDGGDGTTLAELGQRHKLSRERVRQIIAGVVARARQEAAREEDGVVLHF